jgi:hypothetical protein
MEFAMSVTLLVGTTKGAFLLERAEGGRFTVRGPFCNGWSINHFASGGGTIWAGGGNGWFGAGVWRSTDGGATWELSKLANGDFDKWMMNDPAQAAAWGVPTPEPAPFTGEVDAVWSLARVGDTLYAGTKPATLFASDDGGVTFRKVQALTDHPTRPEWEPGAAGLTLHTIVADPAQTEKLWLPGSLRPKMAARPLNAGCGGRMKRSSMTITAMATRSVIASTTWCARRATAMCCISRTITASGGRATAGAAGRTRRPACPRISAFRSPSIRATPKRCG